MEGLTKRQIEVADGVALRVGARRPRDAATLILLDRSGDQVRVLMGRRHTRHAFMPGKFVFPGGRTETADGFVTVAGDLPQPDVLRLAAAKRGCTPRRARAVALSAVRETYEEAGLLIGERRAAGARSATQEGWQAFVDNAVVPSLAGLRVVARAITPPGQVRRFDTIFFAAFRDAIAMELPGGGPTGELEDLAWLSFAETRGADLPLITRTVIADLEARLRDDPELGPGGPAAFYRMVRNRFARSLF